MPAALSYGLSSNLLAWGWEDEFFFNIKSNIRCVINVRRQLVEINPWEST